MKSHFRVKYQEAGGSQLANFFCTYTGKGGHCGRSGCPPCDSTEDGKRANCKSKNILYESKCLVCNPPSNEDKPSKRLDVVGRKGIYLGESSRSLHERSVEHHRDANAFSNKSHIIKHWVMSHPELDERPAFKFTIKTQYKDCLSRQVGEAIEILHSKDDLLNSKSEYLNNCLTRITITEQNWERRERERLEDEAEKLESAKIENFRIEKMKKSNSNAVSAHPSHPELPTMSTPLIDETSS